ncbi:MAG: RHS repeat protein, partial [Deltaproteobacteria bacterium]|nr:RHS repeat protein [Deltaproteobacteria bacterium]
NCNGADSIPDDTTPPTVLINTPAEDATVTFLTDIIGTADDANFLRYVLQIAPVDSPQFVTFASGTVPVIGGVLGQFDPTLLENGIYRIRLVAEDVNGQISVDERVYRVAGEAKPGVFALSFIDLQIPVSGIPITVIRSYDSRIKEKRDFGIGWDLQIKTGSYKHNRTPGLGWIINDKPFLGNFLPCIGGTSETRSHFTEVRLSDREVYSFALGITNGNLGITGACEGEASFRFIDGPTPGAKLDILDGTSVIYLRGGSDQVLDMNAFLDGTEVVYNPKKVRLRTIDGRKIDFDRTAGITRIEDNNGNQLSITPGGITHSSGKSIAFQRDLQGRITRITDPIGNMLNYSYDGNGDL